nr:hypothetical protein HK105_008310 [Polyrhizophydium stewartii]
MNVPGDPLRPNDSNFGCHSHSGSSDGSDSASEEADDRDVVELDFDRRFSFAHPNLTLNAAIASGRMLSLVKEPASRIYVA